jgi:phosphate starvation-inducible PhoH-like protein
MRRQIELSNEVATALSGTHDEILRQLESHVGCDLFLRGNLITLDGDPEAVANAAVVVRELSELIENGHEIAPGTIDAVTSALDQHESPAKVLEDVVWRHRSTKVAPKSVNQKRYVDCIRRSTVTFGIGPAGTGKTFLAVAMAAAALSRREVNRIILTRPAVEAGERLGFLPGDLMAKIDPYLRPLFDALNDMLDPEKVAGFLEKGVIEVAPLAFMRGRAQPVDTPVLTPTGWQPIGTLRVGDLVVGSDGRPTPVLGVFPQGRKPVFAVRTQDGAATRACAEHLWAVTTASDRRRGRAPRVLQTGDMVGRLRSARRPRYALPLTDPVAFEEQDVPLDPYALGRLLGDGCPTAATPPALATTGAELTGALEAAVPAIAVRRASDVGGGRGGVMVAPPLAAALHELGLAGTRSATAFVPQRYLVNRAEVRLGVLQGLLDSDAGRVVPERRTGLIELTTRSPRLRDDVVFLVRSLGGVATTRTRAGAGHALGRAGERAVDDRADAHVVDVRLPAAIEPFRLARKRDRHAAAGGGARPARFIEAIAPAGEAECVCIAVGAQDSLYVTEDFLVTHNTLNDSFVILDEAQNTSPEQMKMFLTRLGFGSKMVITGDVTQVDLPRDQRSGLIVVSEILADVEGVEFVRFGGDDVVRHRLVQRIVEAYDEHDAGQPRDLRAADRGPRRA